MEDFMLMLIGASASLNEAPKAEIFPQFSDDIFYSSPSVWQPFLVVTLHMFQLVHFYGPLYLWMNHEFISITQCNITNQSIDQSIYLHSNPNVITQ